MPTRWRPIDYCQCALIFNDGPQRLPTFITRCEDHLDEPEEVVLAECAGADAARSLLMDAGVQELDIVIRFKSNGRGKRECTLTVPGGRSPAISTSAIIARLAEWGYPPAYADRIAIIHRT